VNKVHFIFGVHNHQPIGNFGFVFEKAYTQSYLPFLEAMERHPTIHWNLHTTGILWDWLESHHVDYLDRIAEQVKQGRLEILTGGYYEPILPSLPDADKAGQIQKLSRYIRHRFKTKPKGMWLAERVWEPHLTRVLHEQGVEYTMVDDTHFLSTGMPLEDMCGAHVSEEQGASVLVLPIRQDLRYAIPFKDPGETLNILRQYATAWGHKALVMFDDGEKFGLWPGTYKHVYESGWLENFLTVLESNKDWIVTSRISDYLSAHVPLGRVYLPTASYFEMGEWTLPAGPQEALLDLLKRVPPEEQASAKRFVRGGFWRNFLTKYEESNNIHKKMLRVSEKVHAALASTRSASKGQKWLDNLWAGQCNCAYWHGVFGGLYLPHLRQALYRELLAAELQADKVLAGDSIQVSQVDFDKDGRNEILVEAPLQNLYVSPHLGGSIFEWDLRKEGINLQNVLTRRTEGYHKQLIDFVAHHGGDAGHPVKTIHEMVRVKEPGLEKRLFTDWYRRTSLLDHFLHPSTKIEDYYRCQYGEQGDFIKMTYQEDVVGDKFPQIRLSRLGSVWAGDQKNMVSVEKTLSLTDATSWQVVYRIENVHGPACQLWFGCEMNLAFSSQDQQDPIEHFQQNQWIRRDHGYGLVLKLQFDLPTDLWEFPLETVSLSEEGFERTYQGTVLLAHSKVSLQPGQVWVRSWRVGAMAE
jgi:4-alpha-glucanotransferase